MAAPKKKVVAKEESPKPAKRKKKLEGKWTTNLYIKGYGRVWEGDDVNAEALALLSDASKYVA